MKLVGWFSVVLGITFFIHGLAKFQGGIENTVGWFASIGLGALAYAVASIELVGGILLIIGLGSRIVWAILGCLNDWRYIKGEISYWIFREWANGRI